MTSDPVDLKLDVVPRSRFDMVDLRGLVSAAHGAALSAYSHCLYWSSHTTAGFLDRSMASRLLQKPGVAAYIDAFRAIFPEGADYEHDRMDRRVELAPEQRVVEPKNADSHLAFIAAGLRTCVTYANKPDEPVCFVDLDGVNAGRPRRRHTRIIGYQREEIVARHQIEVPVSSHPVDSVNLKDPRLGIAQELAEFVRRHGVPKGRLRLALHAGERHAGLTVNEYETLLMRHDLPDVLRDPLRFAIEKGRHAIADPRAVPAKTLEYAKYQSRARDEPGSRPAWTERVARRTPPGADDGGPGQPVPAHEAVGGPAGVRRGARAGVGRRRHLPEHDSRPVAPCRSPVAPGRRHADAPALTHLHECAHVA